MAPVSLDELGMVEAALLAAAQAMRQAESWLSCRDQDKDLMATVEEVIHTLRGELSRERLEKTALGSYFIVLFGGALLYQVVTL